MRNSITILLLIIGFSLCAQTRYPIIPKPVYLEHQDGIFELNKKTVIYIPESNDKSKNVISALQRSISELTGYSLKVKTGKARNNTISFIYEPSIEHKEGYKLSILKNRIDIHYSSWQGAFYAVQTIRQLFPIVVCKVSKIQIPQVNIVDYPLLSYRGYLLDVARYFFPISHLYKTIDLLAFYKINVFHIHLTDDQGWRFESIKYPKLQEIAAWRNETQYGHRLDTPTTFDRVKHGGYYSQVELKELVRYADERFITIIPEVDIPGHTHALLAAYPEFGCVDDTTYTVSTIWGIHDNILCPKEITFKFLNDIFDEVMSVFPSKYIHIGGDEVAKRRWEESAFTQEFISKNNLENEKGLQSYFIKRTEEYINSKGRSIIGWDEILEGGLAPNATVMSWRGEKGGIEAAKSKHNVIMTPSAYMYVNFYNTHFRSQLEPLANRQVLPLKKVYNYNPFPAILSEIEKKYIMGLQASLWTEYCRNQETAESLTFPRLCAMSESAWTPTKLKDYSDFYNRLVLNIKHLDRWSVNYSKLFLEYE